MVARAQGSLDSMGDPRKELEARAAGQRTLPQHTTHRTSNEVMNARGHILGKVTLAKSDLTNMIEGGHRNWAAVRAALEVYIDFQSAADVLAGYEAVAPVTPAQPNTPRHVPRGGGRMIEACTWPHCSCPDGVNVPARTCIVVPGIGG